MLGQVDVSITASQEHVHRKVRLELVLAEHLESEPPIPSGGLASAVDSENRHQRLCHQAMLSHEHRMQITFAERSPTGSPIGG